MSNIPKNNFNLEEIYGINNLNNENILNNYGSLIQSNTNSYQFPQSQGYFVGGGLENSGRIKFPFKFIFSYYSSIGNQFGDNNNFIYGNGIPSEFDIEGRDEEEEEQSDDWNENQQQKFSVSTGNLIGEAAARAVLEGLEGKGGKGEQQMRKTLIENNKNNYFKLDEQPYIDYLNIVNKNNNNQLIPNIWQSEGRKNLCGSSSSGVAPFVGLETSLQGIDSIKDPCQQSPTTSFSSSYPPPQTSNNNNLISSKSFIKPPTSFNLNNLLTQPTTNTSSSSLSSSFSSSSSNNHYSLRGSDIPFPFGTLQNKEKEEQLLPSNLKEEQQHQQPIQKSVTSIQALTQQILRLPAVLYADSSSSGSRKLETLLREVYGLPLVTFYVDRIGNGKPRLVERNLEQLTAHRGLPYLFICGTFIGSKGKRGKEFC
ncbi:unnamed protein product [Meloidogyne enterolobii]|uniref:Uncharacterized protein n=1 Tax=Meloidogyne enterolobii TaxID=390850 RepID=A0ACB0XQT3_MELEN